jgi:hypothetical protein
VQHLEMPVPELIMVMPVIAKPVRNATDAVGAAPLDEGPLLRCKADIDHLQFDACF